MKKVLILGSAGMAGHVMAEYFFLSGEYKIFGVDLISSRFTDKKIDIMKFEVLADYIKEVRPHYVINCIGLLVEKSNSDIKSAILVNSYFPHFLSGLGGVINFKLLHLSTDCVFSGNVGGYFENSFRDGDDNYARSKALGEVNNAKDLTIRTSIIGPEINVNGTGLFNWFMHQKGEINGYSNSYWSGVTTLELAKASYEFIKQDITGLYHLCPEEKISKYDLLKSFRLHWNSEIIINKFEDYKSDKSLINTRNDFKYPNPDYKKMFEELYSWIKDRPDLYPHYMI